MNVASNGALPFTTKAKNVNDVLNLDQVSIQKNLEKKALEIVKRHTKFADRVNYSRGTHPKEVGEYDALAYLPDQNILLNIECKVIGGAYCLKDAKTLRDKIFREEIENGRKVKNPGNLAIVEKREAYLKDNLQTFSSKLGWPIKANPQVFSIYLTRYNYWWTYYPPRKTSVKFMRIDVFDDYLQQIMRPSVV
jgi:hypothetical protein